MGDQVRLRPVEAADLAELLRFYRDPAAPGEFQWFGFRTATARELERRWAEDGLVGGTPRPWSSAWETAATPGT